METVIITKAANNPPLLHNQIVVLMLKRDINCVIFVAFV